MPDRGLSESGTLIADPRLELRSIAETLARARDEIAALGSGRPRAAVACADAELDAIVRDTEAATHVIMSAAEALLACDAEDLPSYRSEVHAQALLIFEACAFQDITGQRVSKIIGVLREVEARAMRLAAEPAPEQTGDGLLNGPGIAGPEISQTAIDALFAAP